MAFLDASPSPAHAVAEAARRLDAAGATRLALEDAWTDEPGCRYVVRGGALVAWTVPDGAPPARGFRIVGAHTDSPTLKVKPHPDTGAVGWQQVAIEVYGGALVNSWLDRDLGLAGRVAVRHDDGLRTHLLHVDRPLLRVPQLAIHLDRDVATSGLKLNPQQHLTPVWGLGRPTEGAFAGFVADELGVDVDAVIAWDLVCVDTTRAALIGRDQELLASGRLDNLLSCWAAVTALAGPPLPAEEASLDPSDLPVQVICLFDHEEVGSTSATGADGALLAQVLERTVLARGGTRDDVLRAFAASRCASADGAHATHPNYPERHEPGHLVAIDGGPVIKVNANQRYATDATTAAAMVDACLTAGVPHQVFVSRNDQPCGSTIGPLTSARLGIPTVDVGVAQLSMHSARELCGVTDPPRFAAALSAFLVG